MVHLGATGHARLGWCTQRAELQAPVGFDAHGFCYRDLEGSKVHRGLREPYGKPYGAGDVVSHLFERVLSPLDDQGGSCVWCGQRSKRAGRVACARLSLHGVRVCVRRWAC